MLLHHGALPLYITNPLHPIAPHPFRQVASLKASLFTAVGATLEVMQRVSSSKKLDDDVAKLFPVHCQNMADLEQSPSMFETLKAAAEYVRLGLGAAYNRAEALYFIMKLQRRFNGLTPDLSSIDAEASRLGEQLMEGGRSADSKKEVVRVLEAVTASTSSKRNAIESFAVQTKRCLATFACNQDLPTRGMNTAMRDAGLATLENKLLTAERNKLQRIHSAGETCSNLADVKTATELQGRADTVADVWDASTSTQYQNKVPWSVLSRIQPCEHDVCRMHYDAAELVAFNTLTRESFSAEAKEYHSNLPSQQRNARRDFERASATTPTFESVASLHSLGKVMTTNNGKLGSCACSEVNQLALNTYATLKAASQQGNDVAVLEALTESPPRALNLPGRPSWLTEAYKAVVVCARVNIVEASGDEAQLDVDHCSRQINLMEAASADAADAAELASLNPYITAVAELPARAWIADIDSATDAGDLHLFGTLLDSVPRTSSNARRGIRGIVEEKETAAWTLVPSLAEAAVSSAFEGANAHAHGSLRRLREAFLAPLIEMAEGGGQRHSAKSSAKERLVSLQRIVSEGECVFGLPSTRSVVDGMHIHSAIEVTPWEAKYGGVVLKSCAKGIEGVRVPADIFDDCKPAKTIVVPRHGLQTLNRDYSGHRGNHTVSITIRGYKADVVAGDGSLTLVPTANSNPQKASQKFPGALGSLHKYKPEQAARHAAVSASSASTAAKVAPTPAPPQPKPLSKADKVAAYGTLLNGIRDLQPLAVLKAAFCTSMGIGADSDDATLEKVFKSAKRASLTKGEYRHVDQGGSPSKSAFALNMAKHILFPEKNEEEQLDLRRMYDGLASRLVPDWKNWTGWTRTSRDGMADTDTGDPTEELKLIFETFERIYPDFKMGALLAVEPITARKETVQAADFNGKGGYTQSQVKFVPGGGKPHAKYPWRGDLKIDVHVDDIKANLTGYEHILEKRKLKWDLQVTYVLTNYEIYSGKATIVLEHPDGETYYINIAAEPPLDGSSSGGGGGGGSGKSGSGSIFEAGKHVYQLSSLGVSKEKGTKRRGDLYLILDSSSSLL